MIDVLLSVRNGAKYLSQSIESILAQTLKEFKFYIINDGSDDNSEDLIRRYYDPRIIFFQNKTSQGLTKSLNFLLHQSNNKYVARQDADDISHPERLACELAYLMNKNLDLISCNANLIDENNKIIGERTYHSKNIKKDLIKYNMFLHSSWLVRRQVFQKLKGYDENYLYAQDYDFLLRAVNKFKLGILNHKLVGLRWDSQSVSLKHLKAQQKYALLARLNAIKRSDYSLTNYLHLIKPSVSYLLPSSFNKFIYQQIYHD